MGLLDSRQKAVELYPEVQTQDGAGNPVRRPGTTPTVVYGLLQPISSTEAPGTDQDVSTTHRLILSALPAGAWAKAVTGGRTWDVVGEPLRRSDSPSTRHVTVLLRARTAEPLT